MHGFEEDSSVKLSKNARFECEVEDVNVSAVDLIDVSEEELSPSPEARTLYQPLVEDISDDEELGSLGAK